MNQRPLVIKFGGTSVGDGAAFVRAAKIAAGAAKNRPVAVVVSAMSGTTDALLDFAAATVRTTGDDLHRTTTDATREGSLAELHRALARRHLRAAREAVPEEFLADVEERLRGILGRLIEVANAPVADSAARNDAVVSFGERLSAEILAGAISGFGEPAAVVAADPIATDASFGEADEDLLLGLRCLHNAGIRTLWAGNTCAGLVFAVDEGEAEAALRAVYAGLIPVETAADMEEVA